MAKKVTLIVIDRSACNYNLNNVSLLASFSGAVGV